MNAFIIKKNLWRFTKAAITGCFIWNYGVSIHRVDSEIMYPDLQKGDWVLSSNFWSKTVNKGALIRYHSKWIPFRNEYARLVGLGDDWVQVRDRKDRVETLVPLGQVWIENYSLEQKNKAPSSVLDPKFDKRAKKKNNLLPVNLIKGEIVAVIYPLKNMKWIVQRRKEYEQRTNIVETTPFNGKI